MAKTKTSPWSDVFEMHPDVHTIFVVKGQPFIERKHADNYARSTNETVDVVKRAAEPRDPEAPKGQATEPAKKAEETTNTAAEVAQSSKEK